MTVAPEGYWTLSEPGDYEETLFDFEQYLEEHGVWIGDIVERVHILEGITSIEEGAFRNYYLFELELPSSLQRIEDGAFYGTEVGRALFLPENVSYIGKEAFFDMKVYDFQVDSRNRYFASELGVLYDKQMTHLISFVGSMGKSSLEIPVGVQVIADGAFFKCEELQNITLPMGLQSIGAFAFQNSGIREIVIPEGIEILAVGTFLNSALERIVLPSTISEMEYCSMSCPNLREIVFMGPPPAVIGEDVFGGCPEDMVIRYPVQYASEWDKNGVATWQGFRIQPFDASLGVPDKL